MFAEVRRRVPQNLQQVQDDQVGGGGEGPRPSLLFFPQGVSREHN